MACATVMPVSAELDTDALPFLQMSQTDLHDVYIKQSEAFIGAKSAAEAGKLLLDGENTPEFMKAYNRLHKVQTGKIIGKPVIFSFVDKQYAILSMKLKGLAKGSIYLFWDSQDELPKVDWQATYAYCEMNWDPFFAKKPTEETAARVFILKSDYYNFEFGDDSEWVCFKALHPQLDRSLYAYVKKDSEDHKRIEELFKKKRRVDLNLGLRFLPGSKSSNQVEITKIIGDTWLNQKSLPQSK